jgi:hypothetical protein
MCRKQLRQGFAVLVLAAQASVLQAQPVPESMVQAIDRFLIHEVQTRYALAHDQTEPDAYAAVFTDDAEIHGGNGLIAKGTAAIREMAAGNRLRLNPDAEDGAQVFGPMRHMVVNSDIRNTSATTATGSCYVLVIASNKTTGNPDILGFARYVDEYRKVDRQWLIARREIIMDMSNAALMQSLGL